MNATVLLKTLTDPAVFGPFFGDRSWSAWRACVAAIFGVTPTDPTGSELVRRCTGRTRCPTAPARETWLIVGRRGGKSRIAALIAVLLGCFKSYEDLLAPGERGVLMVLAADRHQARVVFSYILALLKAVPMLRAMIVGEPTREAIYLSNGVVIEIHTSSFRSVRDYTIIGAVLSEVAFWSTEDSANPDAEIVNAIRPAMATIPGALLVVISSPYARRGELFKAHREHFGKDGDPVLVFQAPSLLMNPDNAKLRETVAQAYKDDEVVADAEYGANFRRDLERYVSKEVLDAAVIAGRRELLPRAAWTYAGFVDPAGGSGEDAMTVAIAHREPGGRLVLDALREKRPPFNPDVVAAEFAALLKTYGVSTISGDRYGGDWPASRFRAHGVAYTPSEATKSEIYSAFLPLLNSGQVELLDDATLARQLGNLERRTTRGGREIIDAPPRQHDDTANAAAGALASLWRAEASGPTVAVLRPNHYHRETELETIHRLQVRDDRQLTARERRAVLVARERLERLVYEFGSEAVERIRRLKDPMFTLPEELTDIPPAPTAPRTESVPVEQEA